MLRYWLFVNLIISCLVFGQEDSLKPKKPQLYRNQVVLYADHGINSSPFSLNYPFTSEVNKLAFKHNLKPLFGFGIQYKWFGLRIGFSSKGQYRPISRYGRSEYFDIGFRINTKRMFWDVDFRNYRGYVVKDAYKWNDTLDGLNPNLAIPGVSSSSFSVNTWYFKNRNYRMTAVLGIADEFTQTEETWYFKGTFNIFGVGNDAKNLALIQANDTIDGKTKVKTLGAMDIGCVPGYAYTKRLNNWQASVFGGLGGVLQAKWFVHDSITRGFLGIAPRVDLRFVGGYSTPRYFVWFASDFDIKSIRFQKLSYFQTYYQLRLIAGIRLRNKKMKLEN